LSDEEFAEIAAALEEKGRGQEMLIDLLAGRNGPQSEAVRKETANLARLEEAALSFYGWSWRHNVGNGPPPGSVFKPPPGADGGTKPYH
jgi:hypothetical protein